MKRITLAGFVLAALCVGSAWAQEPENKPKPGLSQGSIVEDRAARKLMEAGDARFDGNEFGKAVEIWQSVVERYPRSKVRYEAHMRLGNYFLERDRAYDKARVQWSTKGTLERANFKR